ncbi:hypothetical protein M405DRAFT_76236 [Rhizopogon salebrosus TDB-379]|nr:hypothetical protein M405DRAFT_76236 [Rhizopogon salebrosus TDB-379]
MPTCGGLTAPRLIEKLKIKSQNDVKQLAEAKEIAYKDGFHRPLRVKRNGQPLAYAHTPYRLQLALTSSPCLD